MAFVTRTSSASSIVTLSPAALFKKNHRAATLPLSTLSSSFNGHTVNQPLKTISELPGPVRLPLVGTAWIFFAGTGGKPLGKTILSMQEDLVNKYGRIFRLQLPGMTVVQIADPLDVATVLRNESKYPQRLQFPVLDYYRETRQKIPGVFFVDGPEWYKYRSVLSKKMLRPKQVADYASGFNEIITDFIHRLRTVREPIDSQNANEVSGLDNELFKWSFESVAELLFDKRFGCLEPEVNKEAEIFIKAIGEFLYNAIGVAFLPNWFYKIYETEQFKKFFDSFDTMYEYAEVFIQRRINEIKHATRQSVTMTKQVSLSFFCQVESSPKTTFLRA